jgi:2-polyprenyl-3-methyl-5-hydroxy-6-metoxy-1,4-benzoquinol methylase
MRFEHGNYELLQQFVSDYRAIYSGFLAFVRRHCPAPAGRAILDIGCFSVAFLDLAQEAGFLTYGVECQPEAAAIANAKHGGRVFCGPIEAYSPQLPMSFDVVTAFGVIEHVTDPRLTVRVVSHLLRPGGLFVIQTPNTGSLPGEAPRRVLASLCPRGAYLLFFLA